MGTFEVGNGLFLRFWLVDQVSRTSVCRYQATRILHESQDPERMLRCLGLFVEVVPLGADQGLRNVILFGVGVQVSE